MLTAQQVEQFGADGYLIFDPCLEDGEEVCAAACARSARETSTSMGPTTGLTLLLHRADDHDHRVALDDVTEVNGCIYVVPGSHKLGAVEHSEPWMVGDRRDMKIPDTAIDRDREQPTHCGREAVPFTMVCFSTAPGPTAPTVFAAAWRPLHDVVLTVDRRTGRTSEYTLLHGREFEDCV